MQMFRSKTPNWILLILGIILINRLPAFACKCELPTTCQAFSRAESVFVGTLIDVEVDKKPFIPIAQARFEVEKPLKGTKGKIEVVQFELSDCFQIPLKIGEKYFVYKDPPNALNIFCNRTSLLANSSTELKYANSLSQKHPVFTIGGFINNLPKEKLKDTKVIVTTARNSYGVPIDSEGFFDFTARKPAIYTVKIVLPFEAATMVKNLENYTQFVGGTIEYSPQYRANACDYREFQVGPPK